MYVIKRYPNRKLYDTERKRYITLEGIANLIRKGKDVQVVDYETGEDLTTITLSQIILEQERRRVGILPKGMLTHLIRTGGDTFDMLKRSFYTSVGAARLLEEEIEKRIDTLVRHGQLKEDEARRLRHELLSPVEQPTIKQPELATRQPEQDRVESPIEAALDRLNIPSRSDIRRLSAQLEELSAKLDSLLKLPEE